MSAQAPAVLGLVGGAGRRRALNHYIADEAAHQLDVLATHPFFAGKILQHRPVPEYLQYFGRATGSGTGGRGLGGAGDSRLVAGIGLLLTLEQLADILIEILGAARHHEISLGSLHLRLETVRHYRRKRTGCGGHQRLGRLAVVQLQRVQPICDRFEGLDGVGHLGRQGLKGDVKGRCRCCRQNVLELLHQVVHVQERETAEEHVNAAAAGFQLRERGSEQVVVGVRPPGRKAPPGIVATLRSFVVAG